MECRLATLTLANGNEVLSYSADNAQLDLYDAQKSRIGFGRLSDLVTVPSMFQRLPDDTQVEELGDRIQIDATEAILVADRKTGFVHEMNSMRPDGSGLTVQQFGPVSHPNGAVTPTLRIEANFRNHTLDRAQVVFLDEVDFEAEFLPNAFSFAAPAGTNLLDYRDVDRQQVGSRPRAKVTMGPVSDVVATANSTRPLARPPQVPSAANAGTVKTPAMKRLQLGDKSPEFRVAAWHDQNGKTSAPDLKGKVVIINFHRDYDHNSEENRELRQALKTFEGQAVEIISIFSHRTDAEKAVAYMKKFQLPWKFAIDTPAEGTRYPYDATFTAFHLPRPTTTVVINSSGGVYSAESHNNQIRDAIHAAVSLSGIKE
jgi:peroxiredoxin